MTEVNTQAALAATLKDNYGGYTVSDNDGQPALATGSFFYTQTTLAPAQKEFDADLKAVNLAKAAVSADAAVEGAKKAFEFANKAANEAEQTLKTAEESQNEKIKDHTEKNYGFAVNKDKTALDKGYILGNLIGWGFEDAQVAFNGALEEIKEASEKVNNAKTFATEKRQAANEAQTALKNAKATAAAAHTAAKEALDATADKPEALSIFQKLSSYVTDAYNFVTGTIVGFFSGIAAIFRGIFGSDASSEAEANNAGEAADANEPAVQSQIPANQAD